MERWIAQRITLGLRKFEGRHEGESCYIFGDGPSIKWFDFARLNDMPAICCGMIPFHVDFHKLDARYLAMVEPWLFVPEVFQPPVPHLKQLTTIASEYRQLPQQHPEKEFFINASNRLSVRGGNVNYVHKEWPRIRNDLDAELARFNLFGGSFHATLSLAYFMGFARCYLVGFDAWTIQPSRTLRWYELGQGEFFHATNFATDFLGVLKKRMTLHTIVVDGSSCNTEAISYREHTGAEPVFRENHQLLTPDRLRTIATCGEYKVLPVSQLEMSA